MISEDDKRFYELSARQAMDRMGKRRLAKSPARVYDRDVKLKKEQEPLLTME